MREIDLMRKKLVEAGFSRERVEQALIERESLRDRIMMSALTSLTQHHDPEAKARAAYDIADACLKIRAPGE